MSCMRSLTFCTKEYKHFWDLENSKSGAARAARSSELLVTVSEVVDVFAILRDHQNVLARNEKEFISLCLHNDSDWVRDMSIFGKFLLIFL